MLAQFAFYLLQIIFVVVKCLLNLRGFGPEFLGRLLQTAPEKSTIGNDGPAGVVILFPKVALLRLITKLY